jgi:hypothetical protein
MRGVVGEVMNEALRRAKSILDGIAESVQKSEPPTEPTSLEYTPQLMDEKYPPRPFGCEFTFIKPSNRSDRPIGRAADILKTRYAEYYSAHNDCGALEIRSPLFHTYTSAVEYWTKLRKIVYKEFKFTPVYKEDGNGGLHIRVDLPKNYIDEVYNLVRLYGRTYPRTVQLFREPGDFETAKPLDAKELELLFDLAYKKKQNIVDWFKRGYRGNTIITFDNSKPSKCIEFRGWDSPKNEEELLFSLLIANLSISKTVIKERYESYYADNNVQHLLIGLTKDVNLANHIARVFETRIQRHGLYACKKKKKGYYDDI